MITTSRITDTHGRTWDETQPGLWRSTDGKYVILRIELPEPSPALRTVYLLRGIDPAMARVHPGSVGYSLAEHGEHHSLEEAQQWAHTDARARRFAKSNDETLDALPADALGRFFWPISNGTTRGALTLAREGDQMVARVVGMGCVDENHWQPGTYTEVSLPLRVPAWRRVLHWFARRV